MLYAENINNLFYHIILYPFIINTYLIYTTTIKIIKNGNNKQKSR